MLENDKGFDLFKLQLFVFTVLIALYVVFRVFRQSAFPALDAEFLLLMGVSNSLYVGSKLAQPSDPLALAQQIKVEWDVLRLQAEDLQKAIEDLEARSKDLTGGMAATVDPVARRRLEGWKTELDKSIEDRRKKLAEVVEARDRKKADYEKAISELSKAGAQASAHP